TAARRRIRPSPGECARTIEARLRARAGSHQFVDALLVYPAEHLLLDATVYGDVHAVATRTSFADHVRCIPHIFGALAGEYPGIQGCFDALDVIRAGASQRRRACDRPRLWLRCVRPWCDLQSFLPPSFCKWTALHILALSTAQ